MTVINLLLLEDQHYCGIKNMSKLLRSQITTHTRILFWCYGCLNAFDSKEKLEQHEKLCNLHDNITIKMPEKGSTIKFKNYNHKLRVPFAIYADFECNLNKIDTCKPNPKDSYTEKIQKHEPVSFCYYITYMNDFYKKPVLYKGKNAPAKFIEMITEEMKNIYNNHLASRQHKPMIITNIEEDQFNKAEFCWICDKKLNDDKVRDHDHLTGKYRGAAHTDCNLNLKIPKFIPIYFHNLSGYDSHLFIKELASNNLNKDITIIPHNEEKYISFSGKVKVSEFCKEKHIIKKQNTGDCSLCLGDNNVKKQMKCDHKYCKNCKKLSKESCIKCNEDMKFEEHDEYVKIIEIIKVYRELRFLDSMKFMSSSLDKLSESLNNDDFKHIINHFGKEKLEYVRRKGIYPYEYMDDWNKFDETQLPAIQDFYSQLKQEHITDEDYEHAQLIWNTFKMKNLGDYHDFYLKLDVLLLADILENFRNICMKNYKLDPCWYYTAPGLSWDSLLYKTKQELELLTDHDILLMIENGLRGGVAMIPNRYSKANNKYMKNKYNPNEKSKYLMNFDVNNLYGWAMMQYLPIGAFKWIDPDEFTEESILKIEDDNNKGYIFEVDLDYPSELHDLHNDLPLAPQHMEIDKIVKLIPNLYDKQKYTLHYRNLKFYLQQGLKLKKIHRIIQFDQKQWMKPYIDLNTELRQQAKTEFEKDFFKLMNNSVFGKTMENIRKRVDIKLVSNKAKAEKFMAKPNFDKATIFSNDLAAIHMKPLELVYNKPVYVGMCILDISKIKVFDFHYNYIKNKYGEKAKLCMTDTDSLLYEIETKDVYKEINPDINKWFDTSNYTDNTKLQSGINKKIPGKMKDENGGEIMTEFIGLRAKLYATKKYNGDESKKAKGVNKSIISKSLTFYDFKNCVLNNTKEYREMYNIRSYKHELYTVRMNKIALSADDDKRIILEDNISTYAYGHNKLNN